ncbi:MAG TPA: energy-coupling factor transporter transmembrane protein EcfT [Desulfocapsa sulfexigens]|nr:energy-coupling factor transporter transmembrane protein EcfT [Desulfocapsa sulfexigens]
MEMIARLQASQYDDSFFHHLDPRVKMGLALIFSLIGPLIENPIMLGVLTFMAMSYLLMAGLGRVLLFIGAFFVVSMVLYLFIEALILNRPPQYIEYLTLVLTMLPIMCIGLLLGMTTSIEKLITALGKLGMPAGMRYAVMVAMRYVAVVGREMHHVIQGMRVRGVMPGWKGLFKNPVYTARIILVPLLIRSFKVADRMGAAAELRGLSAPGNNLQLAELSMTADDWIFLSANLLMVVILWFI